MCPETTKRALAFYENGSWYHRVKLFQPDGTTKYTKKGGFSTQKEAEVSFRKYEEDFKTAYRAYTARRNADFDLKEYLLFWYEQIFSSRVENTTKMIVSYVLYDLLFPNMEYSIKLKSLNVEYLNSLLTQTAKMNASAGNKAREILNIAMKDAVILGYINTNPVIGTKQYKRKAPHVVVLSKEKIKILLTNAAQTGWYLEVLLGLFLGLRKGEISGLKYSDFDMENNTVTISRQITSDPVIETGSSKIIQYAIVEKEPKTPNSFRTLRVPNAILEEVVKRKELNDKNKQQMGDAYQDGGYLSCQKNGVPHAVASFNTALTKLCKRSGLPHVTPHGLRHMCATMLAEQGVPLIKVSALLGHSSVNTTFEYYQDVLDENGKILNYLNDSFTIGDK